MRSARRRSSRPWIGVRGAAVAVLTAAFAFSAEVRTATVLTAADVWSAMRPSPVAASTDDGAVADVRSLRVECLRLRRLLRASPDVAEQLGPRSASSLMATVLWTTAAGRDAVLSVDDGVVKGPAAVAADGEAPLPSDSLVVFGTSVAGRVNTSGSRSASVLTVRSEEFSIGCGLVRDTADGPVEGPAGVYVGGSPAGSVIQIPAEQAVRVGDMVYTLEGSSWSPRRVAIGRVAEAELRPGERDWRIAVKPFADVRRHDRVRVVFPRRSGAAS